MKKKGKLICKYKTIILLISLILIVPSFVNMKLTKINYNILVYLPDDIETMKGQNILADDFNMGAFSVTVLENMNAKDILKLEDKIRDIDGVAKVITGYDVLGTEIPASILPTDIRSKLSKDNNDIMLITYNDEVSSNFSYYPPILLYLGDYCNIKWIQGIKTNQINTSMENINRLANMDI